MIGIPERLQPEQEELKKALDHFSFDLRVAVPGIVTSFDATTQTVTVQPAIRERINLNGVLEEVQLPLLVDVPIVIPRAGGYCLTLPVQAGDECLVVFADACIDAWWQSGGVQNQIDRRRHDLSDGFALVGAWSQPRTISGYSTDSARLRNESGANYIDLNAASIKLAVGASSITITATAITLTAAGQSIVIDASGANFEGKDFMSHKHSGVQTGGGQTGGVVP